MSLHTAKVLTFLMVILSLLSIVVAAFGWIYYPASNNWDFQNNSYFSFNQAMNFTDAPYQGVPYAKSLVSYWSMNEGIGAVAHDSSDNGNNGAVYGAEWVDGKYGKALSFDGTPGNYVDCGTGVNANTGITVSAWIKANNINQSQAIVFKTDATAFSGVFQLRIESNNNSYFLVTNSSNTAVIAIGPEITAGQWYNVVGVYNGSNVIVYVNAVAGAPQSLTGTIKQVTSKTLIGIRDRGTEGKDIPFNGIIDDVRIYNRSLSAAEVAILYAQPDPVSFANYYNFTDPVTNNTMLIHVDNPNANSDNVALVTCTNFFAGNKLVFLANNSATVNVWTNLGQPAFTNGVWNSQDYTTTLTLDASSTAELNWNTYKITTYVDPHSGVSPSNVTVGYGGSQTLNFNASQGYRFTVAVDGVSQGQISSYTFSNVTALHTVNVTSTQLFTITASAGGNGSITPSGPVVVGYGESQRFNFTANPGYHVSKVLVDNVSQSIADSYTFSNIQKNHTINVSFAINTYNITASSDAHSTITPGNVSVIYGVNQQFNMTANSGYYISNVYVDGNDQGNLTTYNFTNVQGNHTISISSAPTNSSTPTQSPTTNPILSPSPSTSPASSPTPSQTPQTNPFPTETALIAVAIIAIIIVVLVLLVKKGYITIRIIKENPEGSEDKSEDYKK